MKITINQKKNVTKFTQKKINSTKEKPFLRQNRSKRPLSTAGPVITGCLSAKRGAKDTDLTYRFFFMKWLLSMFEHAFFTLDSPTLLGPVRLHYNT